MIDLLQVLATRLSRLAPRYFAARLQNPVFIIGSARSGTTLLVKSLASHEEIATYPSEANTLWHPQTYPWRHSPHRDRVPPLWLSPEKFTRLSLDCRADAHMLTVKSTFGAYQVLRRKRFFLNKSAMIAFMIPPIVQAFPHARFIHMIRDGRAVALSYAKKAFKKIMEDPAPYVEQGFSLSFEDVLETCARSWSRHIQEIVTQSRELERRNAIYEVRYERFCQDPRHHLSKLARFIGIDPAGYCLSDYSHIGSRDDKYRRELEPATLRALSQIMRSELEALGYT